MSNQTGNKTIIEVFDPAMCCTTGVCGPDVNDSLADFANDVKWIKTQGIEVNRFNLGREPEVFKSNPAVLSRLQKGGSEILPIIFVNGVLVSEGGYPVRQQLMEWVSTKNASVSNGTDQFSLHTDSMLNELEVAVTRGDQAQLKILFQKGKTLEVSVQSMIQAIETGIKNRQRVTQSTLQTANELLGVQPGGCTPGGGCC